MSDIFTKVLCFNQYYKIGRFDFLPLLLNRVYIIYAFISPIPWARVEHTRCVPLGFFKISVCGLMSGNTALVS